MLLALDASTKSTGYAVYDDNKKLISKGCLTATYQDDLITRIYTMGKKILEVVKEYQKNDKRIILIQNDKNRRSPSRARR